jgi:uncharacterized delta-60 repeat protein
VRRTATAAIASLLLAVWANPAWAAAGDPDPSFGGGDGLVLTPIHRLWVMGGGTVDDRDRTYAVGCVIRPHSSDPFVARYTPPGDLDASFGGDGLKTYDLIDRNDCAFGVAIDSRGRPVVVGSLANRSIFVLRIGEHGARDAAFGTDGVVTTRLGLDADGRAIAFQADGKLLVAGGSDDGLMVMRYLDDGSLDPSFSGNGMARAEIGFATPNAIAVSDTGAIGVVGGRQAFPGDDVQMVVARLTPAGVFDPRFSQDGVIAADPSPFEDRLGGVRFTSTGKMIVGGLIVPSLGAADAYLARYGRDGAPDPTFDGDGVQTVDLGGGEGISFLAAQGSRTVAVGFAGTNVDFDLAIWRVRRDGSLDPGFGGGDGTVTFDNGASELSNTVTVRSGLATIVGSSVTTVGSRSVTTALIARYQLG